MENAKKQLGISIGKLDPKYFWRNERDFAYELYFQMRLQTYPNKIEVTCETSKNSFSMKDEILKDETVKKHFFNDSGSLPSNIYRYPDLLLHEYETKDHQLLAIEIKRRINDNQILRDLSKLIVYCKGDLNYKKGILILINPSNHRFMEVPDIRKLLKDYPEIEIWIVRPNIEIEIYCSTHLIP